MIALGEVADVVRIELSQGHVATIDSADFERECLVELSNGLWWRGRICDRKWNAAVKPHTVYAKSTLCGSVEIRLHRVIVDATRGQLVDHRDHNGLNNVRDNLRVTDCGGNAYNRQRTSGRDLPKGVAFNKETGRYEAYIRYDGKKRHLGLFDDVSVAARAYDAKATELFGEFACLNFPKS